MAIMIGTSVWYPIDFLHRYDFIFLSALAFQLVMLACKLETPKEAIVIVVFHLVATVMELFKTSDSIASWTYPEAYIFGIGNVPLFTGFMYSAVGSYLARVWRVFDFQYVNYPSKLSSILLVAFIYINFFTHHFVADFRWILLVAVSVLFFKTKIYFKVISEYRNMPLLFGWLLVSVFIWFAENIATYANIWVYPNQENGWAMVPIAKLSSWYLLMLLSFVLVSIVSDIKTYSADRDIGTQC